VTITLIVTTYNWEKALELLLMSVLSQTRMPDQFIVADDGSREDTRELIDEFVSRFDIPVLHVWHKDDGFQRSVILNQAIGKATGDYIIQVDGDVILHRCFVEDHEFFAAPGYFIRGHRIRLSKEYSKQVFDQKSIVFNDTFKGLLQVFKTARMRWVSTVFRLDLRRHAEVYGCNLSYWRSDAVAVNGYNEDISGWGCEDQEFVARMTFTGVKRRKIRFAAKQYHLYHPEASQDRLSTNHAILANTISTRSTSCKNGIEKYQTPHL